MQGNIHVLPIGRNRKGTLVTTHSVIIFGNIGRVDRSKRIDSTFINRFIITLHFPVGRNRNFFPATDSGLVKCFRFITGFEGECKIPITIEGEITAAVFSFIFQSISKTSIRISSRSCRIAVDSTDAGIFIGFTLINRWGYGNRCGCLVH